MSKNFIPRLTRSPKRKPRRGAITARTTAANRAAAERLARDYSGLGLDAVLRALVEDMAEAARRPGSWEAGCVTGWLASHPWPDAETREEREEREEEPCQ